VYTVCNYVDLVSYANFKRESGTNKKTNQSITATVSILVTSFGPKHPVLIE